MGAIDVFGIVGTTQAGNFHVERVVAEGGFGVVYRAQHGAFRAPVALKCLKIPEQMTKQQRAIFLEKFREEAELMFRLSAAITEVVRPLHVDVLQLPDGRFVPFLALEWLEGESLDGIITRRREQGQAPLGLHKVVKMLRPVASALARAHRFPGPQGAVSIIHRDLKPENIIVASIGGSESMKILDFGIAKAKRAASQAAGRITGRTLEEDESASFTPAYGAPEQWSPKTYGETGPWTDVWGLALTAVEALCGTPPIDGDTYVMRRACLDDKRRPTPRNLGADVPAEVERVFERALAIDPRKRFKDIEGFWSELEIAIGLPPSLRTRDARREPSEQPDVEALGAGLTATGQRLAKIELLKVPSLPSLPSLPAVRVQSETTPAQSALPLAPRVAPGEPVRRHAPPAPVAAHPPAGVDHPPKHSADARDAAEEDWSTLGLGDGAPAPAAKRPPPVRRASIGLEMPLPSHAGPADLDAAQPTSTGATSAPSVDAPAKAAAPRPAAPSRDALIASRAPARRPSGELELSLPSYDDGAPPPAVSALATAEPARPEPVRRASGELELSLPSVDSVRGLTSRAPDLEQSLPGGAASSARAVDDDDGMDFHLHRSAKNGVAAGAVPGGREVPPVQPLVLAPLRTRQDPRPILTLRERLNAPLKLLLVALAIAMVDFAIHKAMGNPLRLGPVRLTWVAAPLALSGVGFLLFRLIGVHEDE